MRQIGDTAADHLHVEREVGLEAISGHAQGGDRILQVIGNLLQNAIKVVTAGASVWLRASRVDEEVVFSVSDTEVLDLTSLLRLPAPAGVRGRFA